jgi:branched-chain amino acid aminotransferase
MSVVYLNHNGNILPSQEPIFHADNRAFRYGEGLFETMRFQNEKIALWDLHWQRLISSMKKLGMEPSVHWTQEMVLNKILQLAHKNKHLTARVRLTVYRGEGGIWEEPTMPFNFLIQTWALNEHVELNQNGLDLGVFPTGRKACDEYAPLKCNNYLIYLMAARFARTQKWNECLVLNQHHRICDATIANLFFFKDGVLHTPALNEGPVAGVMRTYLIDQLTNSATQVTEGAYSPDDLIDADEIFLTNAVQGIRWVKSFGEKTYGCRQAAQLFDTHIKPLFA